MGVFERHAPASGHPLTRALPRRPRVIYSACENKHAACALGRNLTPVVTARRAHKETRAQASQRERLSLLVGCRRGRARRLKTEPLHADAQQQCVCQQPSMPRWLSSPPSSSSTPPPPLPEHPCLQPPAAATAPGPPCETRPRAPVATARKLWQI
jgi:hypothetical protein